MRHRIDLKGFTAISATLLAPPALAHHAMGGQTPSTMFEGLLSGFAHPILGLDHLAFLAVAALLAMTLSGWARYLTPLVFVAAALGGTVLHLASGTLPQVELLIALSVAVGGLMVLRGPQMSALGAGLFLGLAGLFHGYAYGESIVGAESTPMLAYLAGFSLIQYALILGGVLALERIGRRSASSAGRVTGIGGGVAVVAGAVFAAGALMA